MFDIIAAWCNNEARETDIFTSLTTVLNEI